MTEKEILENFQCIQIVPISNVLLFSQIVGWVFKKIGLFVQRKQNMDIQSQSKIKMED